MTLKSKFPDYLDYLYTKGYQDKTVREHKRFTEGALSHADGLAEKDLKDLKKTDVGKVRKAGREHGRYGAQRAVVTFRKFLKFLEEEGHEVPFNWRDIEVPKVSSPTHYYMDAKKFKEFVEKLPLEDKRDYRLRAMVEIAFSTGMRRQELCDLKLSDIDRKEKQAVVWSDKTEKERPVYFTKRSLKYLDKYLDKRVDDIDYAFVTYWRGEWKQIYHQTAAKHLRKAREDICPNTDITFHTFRRALATVLIEEGANIKAVQHIMGHESVRTTLRYYAMVNKRKAKEIHSDIMNRI